jgi:predicted dehydrogenase
MIKKGEIGEVRFVNAEYPQEWLATPAEKGDNRQAKWRTDPNISGKSNCVGDIGSHVENMVAYMTGLKIKTLCARLDKFVEGRVLDDNASIMVEYETPSGGAVGADAKGVCAKGVCAKGICAKGIYWSSQIAVGYDNALRVRIFGSKGTIQWSQEIPNYIEVFKLGQPNEHWSRGRDAFYPHAQSYSRIPSGHPEGYFEALGNIYKAYIAALAKLKAGQPLSEADMDFPGVEMGIDGVKFINKCVESSNKGAVWVNY